MNCSYYIYDKKEEMFLKVFFAWFENAEDYIADKLDNDFERYVIYKKFI